MAILRMVESPFQIVDPLDERPKFANFGGADDLDPGAEAIGDVLVMQIFVQTILAAGQTQGAAGVVSHGLPRLGLDPGIDLMTTLVQATCGIARRINRHQPRGMPRGSGCQFTAFQKHDVAPAAFGEAIQDVYPDDTSANDHDPRCCLHPIRS